MDARQFGLVWYGLGWVGLFGLVWFGFLERKGLSGEKWVARWVRGEGEDGSE